jgi:hypothetical protein
MAAVIAIYPSLHLNLADDYLGLGRRDAARTHLRWAQEAAAALADDSYGEGVWAAIGRLECRLGEGGPGTWTPPRQRP